MIEEKAIQRKKEIAEKKAKKFSWSWGSIVGGVNKESEEAQQKDFIE